MAAGQVAYVGASAGSLLVVLAVRRPAVTPRSAAPAACLASSCFASRQLKLHHPSTMTVPEYRCSGAP